MAPPISEQTRQETERVRGVQDKQAPRYDRQMNFFDRVLFAGGREWACSRAEGQVLEIAVGTGRVVIGKRITVCPLLVSSCDGS